MFQFFGYRYPDGERARNPYFKQTHALSEAYTDLLDNPGVGSFPYAVDDIWVLDVEGGTVVMVELTLLDDLEAELNNSGRFDA
jgi:hypothetical protein